MIGVPDEKYGEELMAWIRQRPGAPELAAESLRAYCAGKLAHYKIPRNVHLVDALPMTVTGQGAQGRDTRGGVPPAGGGEGSERGTLK
ncbi:acyl-CoA synthetase (AMP-forming)/AMP-acid ligase II [Kitasatospora sp. MAP12-15]|uniref:AMP-binding enzyme n=1 Tax=Kitasatospora sp. MAP12-44 TaxID=3035099 RepID=UPI00247D47B3|nr:acyl-CoA synthetase (AMP-forming)/AMP-acid ligase II [Kitasatospora sp. MAP12-44]